MRIDGLSIATRRVETDLLGSRNRGFVQAITKPLHYTQHMHLPAGCELHVQFHIAFDLLLTSVCGIYRCRLAQ